MIILGIDPGLNKTGWSIISDNDNHIKHLKSGVIKTSNKDTLSLRLGHIANEINYIIKNVQINIVGIEQIFINKNPLSSIKLCHARGVILGIIGKYKIQTYELSPNTIKKYTTGQGHSTKDQMKYIIKLTFKEDLNSLTEDEFDALCIAYSTNIFSKNNL